LQNYTAGNNKITLVTTNDYYTCITNNYVAKDSQVTLNTVRQ